MLTEIDWRPLVLSLEVASIATLVTLVIGTLLARQAKSASIDHGTAPRTTTRERRRSGNRPSAQSGWSTIRAGPSSRTEAVP